MVGVARDLKYARLSEAPRPYVYYPLLQSYVPTFAIHSRASRDLAYRGEAGPRTVTGDRSHDPDRPLARRWRDQTRVALSAYELAAGALSMFGIMTIVLAAIGIYGLVAYTVQQSTQEIGIRMAVGARRGDVVWTFLRRGTVLAAAGACIGLIAAAILSRALGTVLYGVSARDLMSFGGGTAVVMLIALVASIVPAWRASRIDPLDDAASPVTRLFRFGQPSPTREQVRPTNPQAWPVFGPFAVRSRHGTCLCHAHGIVRPRSDLRASAACKRQPAFAITAVLTIALGIGATSAIFSVVNAVLLRPLPYNDAARLGTIWSDLRASATSWTSRCRRATSSISASDTTLFDGFARRHIVPSDDRRRRPGRCRTGHRRRASPPTCSRCSVIACTSAATSSRKTARRSRGATAGRQRCRRRARSRPPPLPNIAILSYEFWQRRYGGDESIVGKTIEFGNGRADIVGVLAPGFELLFPPGTNVDPRPDILIASRVNFETGSRNNVSLRVDRASSSPACRSSRRSRSSIACRPICAAASRSSRPRT